MTATTTISHLQSSFYHIHATLRRDASCYVHRQADKDLFDGLVKGKFCYILTSRQVGKSSLMVRTGWRLREQGITVATLDLQAFGQNLTAEQWYGSLVSRIGRQLMLADELEEFWEDNFRLGPMQRWMEAIRRIVLTNKPGCVVIFVDEIETTRGLSFSADEFFAGIREFYNRRVEDDEMKRLTFCLLGASTPSDLIKDPQSTLFNIGERIELTDFTEAEGAHLAMGLGRPEKVAKKLIKRILYWTGGHPYLTQCLCIAVGNDESVTENRDVDRLCESLFLSERAREQDDNLIFVRERLLRSLVDTVSLLHKYGQILNNERVPFDDSDSLITTLQLSGITKVENGCLIVRNRVYRTAFDRKWIEANIPADEHQRQREALRRGRIQVSKIAIPIILLIAFLAAAAAWEWRQSKLALAEAEQQRAAAVAANEMAEERGREIERQQNEIERRRVAELQSQLQKTAEAEKALWQADLSAWQMIKDDTNIRIFHAFLDVKPHRDFDKKARQRIQELSASSASPTRGAIIGQVSDQKTNQPLGGVIVTAKKQDTGQEWIMVSRPNGWFIIAPLEPGAYTLIVENEGYVKQSLKKVEVSPEMIKRTKLLLQMAK
jgi:type II secretory pathway pseudopilin PulG